MPFPKNLGILNRLRPILQVGLLTALVASAESVRIEAAPEPVALRREALFDGPVLHWDVQVRRVDLAKLRKSGGPW
ncbi:MAG: hypothetical protein EBU81_09045, partial [Proteobacteria bacterium]|nr:hypothetical protein [Pseudomonadota bacterium]